MLRRAGWGIADQALSSLTNFALGIILARSVDASAFGAFTIAFVAYVVGLGVSRSVAAQPLVIRYSAVPPGRWTEGVAAASGVTLWIGITSALIAAAIAALTSGALREAFLVLAIVVPGLLFQDNWRYAFFARGRDSLAFLNDLIWVIVMVPAMVVALIVWPGSIGGPMLAWGGAALVAGVTGYLQTRIRPRPMRARAWLRDHRDLTPRFVGEFGITLAATQLSLVALGAISGLGAAGTLRAAALLLGPLNILFQGVGLIAVPEGVATLKRSGRDLQRFAAVIALVLALVAIAWGAFLTLVPVSTGVLVLGPTWVSAHDLVLPLALALAGSGVVTGAYVALRALAAARQSFRANAVASVLVLGGGVLGAIVAAAPGVAWGLAIGNWAGAAIWWREAGSAFGERVASTSVAVPDQAPGDADAPSGWPM
jgi:O-antigen/teichoic acid export membrane protein